MQLLLCAAAAASIEDDDDGGGDDDYSELWKMIMIMKNKMIVCHYHNFPWKTYRTD